MKRIKLIIGLATTLCCLASTSQGTLTLTVPASGDPGAAVALDLSSQVGVTLVSPISAATFSATLTSRVFQESLGDNPLGGYTFVYTLANTGPSTDDEVARLSIDNWMNLPASGVAGNSASAGAILSTFATRSGNGNVIGFNWYSPDLAPGSFAEVFIRTSMQYMTTASATVQDGSSVTGIPTYAVPEPSTVLAGALLLLPFGASTIRFLRKSRTA